jgi:PAS domain S-box-containing protein
MIPRSRGRAGDEETTLDQLRLLVETNADYAMFLLDPHGHVRTWNVGAERLKGYRAEEIIGEHFSRFYPQAKIDEGWPDTELELAARDGRLEDEGWRVRRDGSQFWASVVITALRDEDGELIGFGKVTRDLTSRRLAEERLRATAADLEGANRTLDQFRLLVASVRDYAIFMLDAGGHIRTWNEGARRITGYEEPEVIGRHFSLFYTGEDLRRNHPADELEIAAREGRFEEEGWRVRKTRERFWSNVVITALRNEHGTLVGYAKVTRDLTERREAEQRQLATAEKLELANAALEEAERRAREDADRQRRRATALEVIGRAIVARLELEEIVQTATDAATEITGAAFGAFFYNVEDEHGEWYTLHTISGVPAERFGSFPMPRNTEVFAPTFAGREIVRSDDITKDPRYAKNPPFNGMPEGHLAVRSYLAVPVVTGDGEVAGGLFFGSPQVGVFGEDDEQAAVSIAASAAVALSNARLLEATRRESAARQAALLERDHVARVLQESLLPPSLPSLQGLDLGATYLAGRELVGGDFYDVVWLGDERWGLVLGDVCGNGPDAASRTALTRHSVRTAAMFDSDPAHVLQALNAALMRSGSDRFSTAVFARLDGPVAGGGVSLRIAAGGHPPAMICRADGTVEECWARGPLLGIMSSIELEVLDRRLEPGDRLVLYTDGLVESRRGGEIFGFERLAAALAELRHRPAGEIAEALVERSREYGGGQLSDDVAVVVLGVPAR